MTCCELVGYSDCTSNSGKERSSVTVMEALPLLEALRLGLGSEHRKEQWPISFLETSKHSHLGSPALELPGPPSITSSYQSGVYEDKALVQAPRKMGPERYSPCSQRKCCLLREVMGT